MSSVLNFDDIYEDFIAVTSSSDSSAFPQPPRHQYRVTDISTLVPNQLVSPVLNKHKMSNQNVLPTWTSYHEHFWNEHQRLQQEQQLRAAPSPPKTIVSSLAPLLLPQPPRRQPRPRFFAPSKVPPLDEDPFARYPGGIEVVMRQVPYGCQALLRPSDVPLEARRRNYFTVAELLALKRELISRYTGQPLVLSDLDDVQPLSSYRRDLKRSHELMEQPEPESEKVSVIRHASTVGGALTEAMKVLDEQHVSSTGINQDSNNYRSDSSTDLLISE